MSEFEVEFLLQSVDISEKDSFLNGLIQGSDLGGPMELSGMPGIHDGRFQLSLQELRLADQIFPEFVTATIKTEIQQVFRQWLWGCEILEIKLMEGKINLIVIDW